MKSLILISLMFLIIGCSANGVENPVKIGNTTSIETPEKVILGKYGYRIYVVNDCDFIYFEQSGAVVHSPTCKNISNHTTN